MQAERERSAARIDWQSTAAGAGAAVTVAVLLSTLGAAGTLVGAALGSVIATVSTALYKQGIESSRRRMAEVQAAALQRVNLADQSVRRAARRSDPVAAERERDRAHRHLDAAGEELADDEAPGADVAPREPSRWARLPWRRLALLAALVFVIAIVAISAVELVAGRSISTITGGTSGSDRTSLTGIIGDDGGKGRDRPRHKPTPGPTSDPTQQPSDQPSDPTTPTAPTPSPTDIETPTPTPSPTEPDPGTSPAPPGEAPTPGGSSTP